MYYLGIHIGHDCTIAVIDQANNLIYAVAEERLSRLKNHYGFPYMALESFFKETGIKPEEIEKIAISGTSTQELPDHMRKYLFQKRPDFDISNGYKPITTAQLIRQGLYHRLIGNQKYSLSNINKTRLSINESLSRYGLTQNKYFFDHHECHALPALIYSKLSDNKLIVTCDCAGDFLSAAIYLWSDNYFQKIAEIDESMSIGAIYSSATEYLGYKRNKHEGKLTGLAAYGDPDHLIDYYLDIMPYDLQKSEFRPSNHSIKINFHEKVLNLIKGRLHAGIPNLIYQKHFTRHFKNESSADIAAALQLATEKVLEDWVSKYVKETEVSSLCLSGGVFSNVKLNQKLMEIDGVKTISVYPNMGDGGTALGSALACNNRLNDQMVIDNLYKGPGFDTKQVLSLAKTEGLRIEQTEGYAIKIATMINEGKIVGRYTGKMEFGPRALGNRSIMADPRNNEINDTLNNRLNRTEFMPFAPSVLSEHAHALFADYMKASDSSRFMTITFNIYDKEWQSKVPGITHVDGTARPQLVHETDNESFYSIIQEFYKLTGIPMIVNTSFNNHEEPIVCTPQNALSCLTQNKIDVLSADDLIITT